MKRARYVIYRTREFDQDDAGAWVPGRWRYFASVKETKAFAISAMKERGGSGYGYESHPSSVIADLLNGEIDIDTLEANQ